MEASGDIGIDTRGHVAIVEIRRPPHNFFDISLIDTIADAFEAIDRETDLRCIVLASEGRSFCAGADLSRPTGDSNELYAAAARLIATRKPIVGAIQGAAVGGGLGLALVPDFRIVSPEARFAANFVKLGVHAGFGITHMLPRLVGNQNAAMMLYTGRRIDGQQALECGLADQLVPADDLREAAVGLASEIAESAPLAVISTRATLRSGLVDVFKAQTAHEAQEQAWLSATEDCREGIKAVAERRPGIFIGA